MQTGQPQNEVKAGADDPFAVLYADEERLEMFLRGLQGFQMGNFMTFLERVDLSSASTLCDVGGASGIFALAAQRFPQLQTVSFDLPAVESIAKRTMSAMGVEDRVEIESGNFFVDELPNADVIVMGNVLHDWDEEQKRELVRKAYAAVNEGGRFIAVENVIDDARRENTVGLLMSLNMLIESPGGFDYTGAQFDGWCREAGFARTEIVPLVGPTSAAIAYK